MPRFAILLSVLGSALLGPLAGVGHADTGVDITGGKYHNRHAVSISGVITCPEGHEYGVAVDVRQQRGFFEASGYGWSWGICTGAPQEFTVEVTSSSGILFRRGKITASAWADSSRCDEFDCYYDFLGEDKQSLRLK